MPNELQDWIKQVKSSGWTNEQIKQKLKKNNYSDEQINNFLSTKPKKKSNILLFLIIAVIIIISIITYLVLIGYLSNKNEEIEITINSQISNLENRNILLSDIMTDDSKVNVMKVAAEELKIYYKNNNKYPTALDKITFNYTSTLYDGRVKLSEKDFEYTTSNNQLGFRICSEIRGNHFGPGLQSESSPMKTFCYDGITFFTPKGDEYLNQFFSQIFIGDDVKRGNGPLVKPLHIEANDNLSTGYITYKVYGYNIGNTYGGLKENQPISKGDNIFWIQTSNVPSWEYYVRIFYKDELMTEIYYQSEDLSPVKAGEVEAL